MSSRSEAAFPVAGVAVSLWVSFPELGELILAHFHSICPVLVPFYMPKKDGLSDSEHLRYMYIYIFILVHNSHHVMSVFN